MRVLSVSLPCLFMIPVSMLAATCPENNPQAVVYFVNGMFNSEEDATNSGRQIRAALRRDRSTSFNYDCVGFGRAYNENETFFPQIFEVLAQQQGEDPSRIWRWLANHDPLPSAAAQYLVDTAADVDESSYVADSDQDLQEHIAMYRTQLGMNRKVLLVPHSQGNFYANLSYEALSNAGLPNAGLTIVSTATPSSFVAGDGPHTTLSEDFIHKVPSALGPNRSHPECAIYDALPAIDDVRNGFACHSFRTSYMLGEGSRKKILDDIVASLPTEPFPPPNQPPSAGFSMSSGTTSATAGETLELTVEPGTTASIAFDGAPPLSSDPDGTVAEYEWTLNGAAASTSGVFALDLEEGTYQVGLIVEDNLGLASVPVIGQIIVRASDGGGSDSGFVSFVQGDPLVPGDSILLTAASFDLRNPISLKSMLNGLTASVFQPAGDTTLYGIQVNLAPLLRSGSCGPAVASVGVGSFSAQTQSRISFNGHPGVAVYVPQPEFADGVALLNTLHPDCEFDLAEFFVSSVAIVRTQESLVKTLDAFAIELGEAAPYFITFGFTGVVTAVRGRRPDGTLATEQELTASLKLSAGTTLSGTLSYTLDAMDDDLGNPNRGNYQYSAGPSRISVTINTTEGPRVVSSDLSKAVMEVVSWDCSPLENTGPCHVDVFGVTWQWVDPTATGGGSAQWELPAGLWSEDINIFILGTQKDVNLIVGDALPLSLDLSLTTDGDPTSLGESFIRADDYSIRFRVTSLARN